METEDGRKPIKTPKEQGYEFGIDPGLILVRCFQNRSDYTVGGRRRLSGFLPVQSIYEDFYVLDDYRPDFKPEHFYKALTWYNEQDITLGG